MSENPNCALAHAVPVLLTTCPAVPGAKKLTALVPAPTNRLFDVRVVLPVPPLPAASGVDKVRLVPVATPMSGVVSVGLVENTTFPVPVLLV
ncbi:hypothetical protein ES703_101795 [subsurface metagenome]